MLVYIFRGLDGVVIGTVATSPNDVFYAATRPYVSRDSASCVLACALFDRCLLVCVRIHIAIAVARMLAIRRLGSVYFFVRSRIRYIRAVCCAVNRGSFVYAMFLDDE